MKFNRFIGISVIAACSLLSACKIPEIPPGLGSLEDYIASLRGALLGQGPGGPVGEILLRTLGNTLTKSDMETHEKLILAAVATGAIQAWSNAETGASGEAKVVEETTKTEQTTVQVLKGKVEQMPPLEGEFTQYTVTANANVNVRGGPGTDYEVIGKQPTGNVVQAQKVKGANWYAIFQGDVGTGFIAADLLKKTPTATVTSTERPAGELAPVETTAERMCRTIEQSVTGDDGTTRTEQIRSCQNPNGQWAIVS